jgi:hypothetical protein
MIPGFPSIGGAELLVLVLERLIRLLGLLLVGGDGIVQNSGQKVVNGETTQTFTSS